MPKMCRGPSGVVHRWWNRLRQLVSEQLVVTLLALCRQLAQIKIAGVGCEKGSGWPCR